MIPFVEVFIDTFISLIQSVSNRAIPEPAVKVWLTALCSIQLWIWSRSSVIRETLTITLILPKWKSTACIEYSEWLNIYTRLITFWGFKYWYQAQKCKVRSTNTKAFFWENEANIETFQKVSSYIVVSRKFVLKSAKCLSWIFWVTEY